MSSCIAADASLSPAKPAWRAVYALALGVFGLIVAEFLPASLLTPMASSLGVSEGMAGQAVTATALVALVTGLLIATATRNIDRRWVLMFFSVLQIVSSLMVAFADSLAFLLLGRLLLGIAIGGFWAMSTATTMRLVPAAHVPKALAIIFSAVSVATVVAAPLGSYLGERYPACWRCSGSCGCCPPCARRASGPSPRCSGCCAVPVCWAACWRQS